MKLLSITIITTALLTFMGCPSKDQSNPPTPPVIIEPMAVGDVVEVPTRVANTPITIKVKQLENFKVYAYSYSHDGTAKQHIVKVYRANTLADSIITNLQTVNSHGVRLPGVNGVYVDPDSNHTETMYEIKVFNANDTPLQSFQTKIFAKDDVNRGDKYVNVAHFYNGNNLNNPTDGVVVIIMNNF